jgi:hypothetical protein
MLAVFLMLMCTVSLTLRKVMDVVVHNQYSDIGLTSPVYFCNHGKYYEYPVERTNGGVMMKIGFRFDFDKLSGGILMYEVQRKGNIRSDHQSSTDTTSTETGKDTSMMRLLVTLKAESFEEPRVHIILAEHDNVLALNEDKLIQLCDKVSDQFSRYYNASRYTWLICDDKVLKATYALVNGKDLELKINISESVKNKDTMKPIWIDSER